MLPTRGYGVGSCIVTWGYGCPSTLLAPATCNFYSTITKQLNIATPITTIFTDISLIDLEINLNH